MGELLLVLCLAAHAGTVGWRHDGSGRWPVTRAPTTWSDPQDVRWSTPLDSWSNASAVPVADMVCVNEEPVSLTCLDAATGAVRWTAAHEVVGVVPEPQRSEVITTIDRINRLEAELKEVRARYGALLREARGGAEGHSTTLETLAARTDAIKVELDGLTNPRTPPNQDMVGWSSPTPVTDGTTIYPLYANGVVAAHALDGTRRWARWLGPMLEPMLGWEEGHAASPVVAGGVLVVPFRELQGLDPATGATRWTAGPWPHYGAPAVARVDGTDVVLTPDGRAVRARDGVVLREGMADVWYVGPVVTGRVALFLEARSDRERQQQGGIDLVAWTLDGLDGDRLDATQAWRVRIPATETFYAAPVPSEAHVHVVTHGGTLYTLETATGALTSTVQLGTLKPSTLYASPVVAGGHLYVTNERGRTAVLTTGATPELVGTEGARPTRASLAFVEGTGFLRTRDGVIAVGR